MTEWETDRQRETGRQSKTQRYIQTARDRETETPRVCNKDRQADWKRQLQGQRKKERAREKERKNAKRCKEGKTYNALLHFSTVWKAFLMTSIDLSISASVRWALTARRMLKTPPHRLMTPFHSHAHPADAFHHLIHSEAFSFQYYLSWVDPVGLTGCSNPLADLCKWRSSWFTSAWTLDCRGLSSDWCN